MKTSSLNINTPPTNLGGFVVIEAGGMLTHALVYSRWDDLGQIFPGGLLRHLTVDGSDIRLTTWDGAETL